MQISESEENSDDQQLQVAHNQNYENVSRYYPQTEKREPDEKPERNERRLTLAQAGASAGRADLVWDEEMRLHVEYFSCTANNNNNNSWLFTI